MGPATGPIHLANHALEAMAHVLATFGQFERRLIGQRTKEALAVKRASGVRLGRPPKVPQAVVRRIQRQRARGDSFRKIAEDLNEAGLPTGQGGARWYAATVRGVLLRTSSYSTESGLSSLPREPLSIAGA